VTAYNQQLVEKQYTSRQRELEVTLGLRLPPFNQAEARAAWPDLIQREILLEKVGDWLEAGLIRPIVTRTMVEQARSQVDDLREQLEGYARPNFPRTDSERLDTINFLLEAVTYVRQRQGFTSPEAEQKILPSLLEEQEQLEIKLDLRPAVSEQPAGPPRPKSPAHRPPAVPVTAGAAALAIPNPVGALVQTPATPGVPFGERLWRTLLSERTLQAMLFLGIFLLFSAAISFVVWGWQDFSAPFRVAIPTGFTTMFFALGWVVRSKTPLYRSGIALSAIAALLIPIDFYTIYVNFYFPPDFWPSFWLITSCFCLAAYTITALIIRSRFFGYLVGVAAGSTVLALIEVGHQAAGLSLDWRTAGLSGVALGLIMLATVWDRQPNVGPWRSLAEPFRYLSLLTVGVLMPLTFGWRFVYRDSYDALHYALTINWWLGGFIFGWGAIFHRSRSLGLLAAIALPVATYLAQAALFNQAGIHPAWHAFGWAWLVPLYLVVGYKLSAIKNDPLLQDHGRTATNWGVALLIIAALWSLTDLTNGAAAASSHTLLAGSVVLAALLWQRPGYLYGASLLSFSAVTFSLTELDLTLAQLSVGWASLAIAFSLVAISLGTRFPSPLPNYAAPLVHSSYAIAALALLPPLFPYNGDVLVYALGNWLGLTAWGARLAHVKQSGFINRAVWSKPIFHWLTACSLPIWLIVLFANNRPLDFGLPLALAMLAWAMLALAYRLAQIDPAYRSPWYLTGGLVSLAAPITAFIIAPSGFTPAIVLLAIGLLYFADAITGRHSGGLLPAGFVTAWGYLLLLDRLGLSFDAIGFALAGLISVYFLCGLVTERRKSALFTQQFLFPLYLTGHILTVVVLCMIYARPIGHLIFAGPWSDTMRLWGAASHLLLGIVYALYAWATYRERWGHVAAWFVAASGGLIAITFTTGRGSSTAKVALVAIAFILTERGLHFLRQQPGLSRRHRAIVRLAWPLYRRPLLVAGWIISAAAIGLALIRNLILLGGGRTQQIWAIAGLLLITGLYAMAARLFRQAHFLWLAAGLIFAPWTLLTYLGWFTSYRPTLPGFALSWLVLAWLLYLGGVWLRRLASPAYARPLTTVAHVLLPFSLLWGIGDVDTSRFTFGLAAGLYALAVWLDYVKLNQASSKSSIIIATKFLYPALGLLPVWCLYLLAWLWPEARFEHYGVLLLVFGPLGLAIGQWFEHTVSIRKAAAVYALPAYLTCYTAIFFGTLLVVDQPPLLAEVLLFDAALLVVSTWLFRNPLWVYPAAILVPISLLVSLHENNIPGNRQGWWLIGLAAGYLALAWLLRRIKLATYSTPLLALGLALIALGLPPSSLDQTGALWGYGSAALLYAIAAFWLKQPLLLTPASVLIIVPYAVIIQRLPLSPAAYGLALFPGVLAALAAGWALDWRKGSWRDFPWDNLDRWPKALLERLLGWWALPLYSLGFGLALAAPFFTAGRMDLSAFNLLLLMPIFGWAIVRFRLRIWLVALALAGHLAAILYLNALGWWQFPAWAWLQFMPVTLITAMSALIIAWHRREGSPFEPGQTFTGWSHPLYVILSFDLILAQLASLEGTWAGATVTIIHLLLLAGLASIWRSSWLAYASAALSVVALGQWGLVFEQPLEHFPVTMALLALVLGLLGYGLSLIRTRLDSDRDLPAWLIMWELPLQHVGIVLSLGALLLATTLGLPIIGWTLRAIFGLSFHHLVDLTMVWMMIGVLSIVGLLYLAVAFSHRWLRLAYFALAMLGGSWFLFALYIQGVDELAHIQLYVIPTGFYLLGISYLEWQQGHKQLGRWLDYAAMLLMMGSLFWQTLIFGLEYAMLLGAEGFGAFWWGSARRLRRFFYAGMGCVILAVLGQLINSLSSINQWIVFGIIGLLLVIVAIFVERKLEEIKLFWQEKILETWE
ncbi:MAG TPA: hypothetical protein VGD99_18280, partial [Anaerolineae bacterium]